MSFKEGDNAGQIKPTKETPIGYFKETDPQLYEEIINVYGEGPGIDNFSIRQLHSFNDVEDPRSIVAHRITGRFFATGGNGPKRK